ncbi:hypothetical protein [Lutibacter sp.]|uniref:hypothetical protein n=1 Tax=Lutibacter sp. TaxID=1925666 RepID=UPI003567CD5F
MKIKHFKTFAFLAIGSLFFLSCENNDSNTATDPIAADDAIAIVEADDVSEDVGNLIDDYFAFEEGLSSKTDTSLKGSPNYLDCMTKTIVIDGTLVTVTLDFGEGCELPNGNILKGKIILSHNLDMEAQSRTISFSYENFYFNDLSVEGSSTMVKLKANDAGNPQSSFTFDFKVTWPEGEFVNRTGTKVREWIEGNDTRDWEDNVYIITGNWSTTFKDGTVYSATIVEPLRREATCRYIVSGTVDIVKGTSTGTLNFGDGTCDDIAIFTNDLGEEVEVTLKCGKG